MTAPASQTTVTLETLRQTLTDFSAKIDEIRQQPDKVDEAFKAVAIAMSAGEGGLLGPVFAVAGGVYGWITEDDLSGYCSENKEKIKKGIEKLLEELADAIEALQAPIAFLQTSDDWRVLGTKVSDAQNDEFARGDLTGFWYGEAFSAYMNSRGLQDAAYSSAVTACGQVADGMSAIAKAAWDFYTEVVKELTEFITSFVSAVGKIAAVVSVMEGVADCIDLLKIMTDSAVSLFKTFTTTLMTQFDVLSKITAAMNNPKGMANNKWPGSSSTTFNTDKPTQTDWRATERPAS
ncbi:hypothetical protein [Nocardia sp. NPDC051832]|uniref:hypothetical protein n=1 Tax=Nocardia sp. NPDC051832 TaxID=3155673 RepID=UPI003431B84B